MTRAHHALWLTLALVACGGDAGPDVSLDTTLDVTPDTILDVTPDTILDVTPDTILDVTLGDTSPDAATASCTDDSQCRLPCAEGRCDDGRCVFIGADPLARGCAIGTDTPVCVDPGAPDPARPTCFFCNPSAAIGAFSAEAFAESFETGAGRVTIEKLTPSAASWTISTRRAAIGSRSLYFGDPSTQSYDVGERAAATAYTAPLDLPEGGLDLVLTFQLWADTEETPGFDRLRVLAVPTAGDPIELWTTDLIGGTTRGEFFPIAVELSRLRPGDRIAFEVDTLDEVINRFEGFYLDAIRLASPCCDRSEDCDDGNACTLDACNDGQCVSTSRPGCCLSDVDCDDGIACTQDACDGDPALGGTCRTTPIDACCERVSDCNDSNLCTEDRCTPNLSDSSDSAAPDAGPGRCINAPLCCANDLQCDDGDPCTAGSCASGQCRYVNACCLVDRDCDDGLVCTLDSCLAGTCTNAFSYSPGCCIPDILTERFDAPLSAWTLSPAANNIGWRLLTSPQAQSPTGLLYYGHPTLGFYESGGRNTGTATTPPIRLPDGVELSLSLSLLIDVEMVSGRDLFRVEALLASGATVVPLIDKAELTRNIWQELSVDLSWASGQVVQLRFVFDTIDGAQNTTRGVFVDDLRLLSSCLSRRCGFTAECSSRASCIAGDCIDNACRFSASCP